MGVRKELSESFGRSIRRERESKGLSQERLAELSELDRSYVQRLESGRYSPSLDSIDRLAAALQLLPSELIALAEGAEDDEEEES